MSLARVFQVALVDRVHPAPSYFGPSAKNEVGNEMHTLGGVASSPTPERAILTAESIRRMSARLFRAVPQYTKAMLE